MRDHHGEVQEAAQGGRSAVTHHEDPRGRGRRGEVVRRSLQQRPTTRLVSARYINTQQTVWDLDFLRRLLDAKNTDRSYPVLNYIGYSYGTWLGAWYADTYPKNVGRFILDSNMQWTASMYTNQTLDSRSFQRRRDKMLFPYLARHNAEFGLGKSAKSVKKKYESTRKKLATQAKKALQEGQDPALGPEDFDYTVSQYIYTDAEFDYAGAIVDAAADYVRKPSSPSTARPWPSGSRPRCRRLRSRCSAPPRR